MADSSTYSGEESARRRYATIALVVLLHVVLLLGLIRAFAPEFVNSVAREVMASVTVTVATKPSEPPKAPDRSGEAAQPAKQAIPSAIKAPKPKAAIAKATAPIAASTGSANTSGATNAGVGTGASGQGNGTGAGNSGDGQGGGTSRKPSVRSGELNQARDFPVPEGGRQARFGKSVTVHFTVTAQGEARDCKVAKSEVDAATTALVCPLVMRKIRFNPALRGDGISVEARYGYRVDFKAM
jgi:periplasmic protein TonB